MIDKGRTKDLESAGGKGKRHGDFAVALAMAVRASWMDGSEIDFTAAPRHSRGFDNMDDSDNDISIPEPQAW